MLATAPTQIYPEVAASLCNVPPFSLTRQPDVIHDTYARIQRFLGAISLDSGSDSELARSALLSQIGISLARGTTDAILSNLLLLLRSPEGTLDFRNALASLSKFLVEDMQTQMTLGRGVQKGCQLLGHARDAHKYVRQVMKRGHPIHRVAAGNGFTVLQTGEKSLKVFSGKEDASPCEVSLPVSLASIGHMSNGRVFAAVGVDGSVWTWGANEMRQLGWSCPAEYAEEAGKVSLPAGCQITHVACGDRHCVACDALGYVSVWGSNAERQCGYDCNPATGQGMLIPSPAFLQSVGGVKDVAAGACHSLMLTAQGEVWGCGGNQMGQLALPETTETSVTVKLNVPCKAVAIAAGSESSFVLSDSGDIWMAGTLTEELSSFSFIKLVDGSVFQGITRMEAGGHGLLFFTSCNELFGLGENGSDLFPTKETVVTKPLELSFSSMIQDVAIAEDHMIVVCTSDEASDLHPSISALTNQELACLQKWSPYRIVTELKELAAAMPIDDVVSVLLALLRCSNQQLFAKERSYLADPSECDFSSCFQLHVTDVSIEDSLSVIELLYNRFVEKYKKNRERGEKEKGAGGESSGASRVLNEIKLGGGVANGVEGGSVASVAPAAVPAMTSAPAAAPTMASASVASVAPAAVPAMAPTMTPAPTMAPAAVPTTTPTTTPTTQPLIPRPSFRNQPGKEDLMEARRKMEDSSRQLDMLLASNRSLLNRSINRSVHSTDEIIHVVEPEGAENFDLDLDGLDDLNLDDLDTLDLKQEHAYEAAYEDETSSCLLFEAVQLLHAQLLFAANTNTSITLNEKTYSMIFRVLTPLLCMDSVTPSLSLVKKETMETLATLSQWCDSLESLSFLIGLVLEQHRAAKKDATLDGMMYLGVVLGLFQNVQSRGLLKRLLSKTDILQACEHMTSIFVGVFDGMKDDLEPLIEHIAKGHDVNASGLTDAINVTVRMLYALYNKCYTESLQGNASAFNRLPSIATAMVKLCDPVLSFSLRVLNQTASTMEKQKEISDVVCQFLNTSPVRKCVQYAIISLYSLLHRPYCETKAKLDYSRISHHLLTEVRSLLRTMSSLVISLDKLICFMEESEFASQSVVLQKRKRILDWMRQSCMTTTTFATAVTTLLINQKPVEQTSETSMDAETSKWLESPLLSRGLNQDLEDPVRKRCMTLLNGEESAEAWWTAIMKTRKLNKLEQRIMNSNPTIGTIVRYVASACMWHCPLCYQELRGGEDAGSAVKGAYSIALKFLQTVNQVHQKGSESYDQLEQEYQKRCRFLLDIQPLWYTSSMESLDSSIAEAYQLLKNEKEIEEDEDEDEDEVGDQVSDALLGMIKRLLTESIQTEEMASAMSSRSSVAENRALSYEYFARLLSKVNDEVTRGDLTESVTAILETPGGSTGCLKSHFISGLEGSSPVYLQRVSDAFASIIRSSMRKMNDPKTGDATRLRVLYSLALPYMPSDAAMLYQSELLESLTRLWSFQNVFARSPTIPAPQKVDRPLLYAAGASYKNSSNSLRSGKLEDLSWEMVSMGNMVTVAQTRSAAYALLESGEVLLLVPNRAPAPVYSSQFVIRELFGSPSGDHLILLTSTGQVISTGGNQCYQCGRARVGDGICHDWDLMKGVVGSYRVSQVACGQMHTLLLTEEGSVLGCGSNAQGQLGVKEPQLKVTEILPELKEVRFLAAGELHSLFASRTSLWVCGSNRRGQLGLDPSTHASVTSIVEVELPKRVVEEGIAGVFAGSAHSGILTEAGSLFLCGANEHGQLGDGTTKDRWSWERIPGLVAKVVSLGGNETVVWDGEHLLGCGDNAQGQLGFLSTLPSLGLHVSLRTPQFDVSRLVTGGVSTLAVLKPTVGRGSPALTEEGLKVRYASWMLASLLFGSCCNDQLELSDFALQFLRLLLHELYASSQFVGDRIVSDEWSGVSPLSIREGSVGIFRFFLDAIEKEEDPEAPPFTYMNQIVSLLLVNARHSAGLVTALSQVRTLSVLLPLFVQTLNLLESMATCSRCESLYLSSQPYMTPVLLLFQNLEALLQVVLPQADPSTVSEVLRTRVPEAVLTRLTLGVPRKTEQYELSAVLLRTMGRIVVVPYGPSQTLIPAPYFCRLVSNKCVELLWSLLPVAAWSQAVSDVVFVCLGLTMDVGQIVQQVLRQSMEQEVLDRLYQLVGCVVLYGGYPVVPSVDAQIAVTVGTLRQEGRILLFQDNKRAISWEGPCIIKLSGSKELAWVHNLREMSLLTTRMPIDSYKLLGRAFDSFEHIISSKEVNRHIRSSAVFGELQQLTMRAVMELLQYPQALPYVSMEVIRSVVSLLHLPLSVQYVGAGMELLEERIELIEQVWRTQAWSAIRGSLETSTTINYNVNTWPPVLPVGMSRCNVCRFPNSPNAPCCALCGATKSMTLTDLVQTMKLRTESRQSIRGSYASQKTLLDSPGAEEEETLGMARKWMFLETVLDCPDAKCQLVGSPVWSEVTILKTQKQILRLGEHCYLRLSQPFVGTGEGVYLNTYSIIMDVVLTDFSSREYTCLLQTDPTNQHPGSFFVRRNGSCGIGVYSSPGVIRDSCLHRIILSVDTFHHVLTWYVDGKKQGELSRETMPQAFVLMDDRWSLDTTFLIGTDCDRSCVGTILISSLQLRRKLVKEVEANKIGQVTLEGAPEPSNEDTILNLQSELHVPYSWCVMALNNVKGQNENAARRWIQENEKSINSILLMEARSLEQLGFDPQRCKKLILLYGSREKALACLEGRMIDQEETLKKEELEEYVKELEKLEESMDGNAKLCHPGEYKNGYWSCCLKKSSQAPPCTSGEGRSIGIIAVKARVRRGPHWKWGNQDGNSFGTVKAVEKWDTHLSKGVVVHWDSGSEGKYRWNVNGCFDLQVIGEGKSQSILCVYGNDSANDNPAYELVDDIKAKFSKVQTKRQTQFSNVLDFTLPEVQEELTAVSRAIASSYSRLALLNILALSSKDEKEQDKLSVTSLFMDSRDNLFESFLSAFINMDHALGEDTHPLTILQREVEDVMKKEVTKADGILSGPTISQEMVQEQFYFWLHSFSRRVLDTMLYEVSLLIQPKQSEARRSLPLAQTTEYQAIARYPERGISFWIPLRDKGVPLATVLKVDEGTTLSLPPTTPTFVFDRQQTKNKQWDCFTEPTRYELVKTFTTGLGSEFTVWRMVPPIDFVAFGLVVGEGKQPPPLSAYCCVRRTLLAPGQAQMIEKANNMLPTMDTFWTAPSIISHFYMSPNAQPPNSNLVFTLDGEGDEQSNGSLQQVGWMLDTFSAVRDNPSQSMGTLTSFVFTPNVLQGLMTYFNTASSEQRVKLLEYAGTVLRRMCTRDVQQPVIDLLGDITQCMNILYEQQKDNNIFSPSFQTILEVMVNASLMCYDNQRWGFPKETQRVQSVLSKKPFFKKLSNVAVVMESLVNRGRMLPLELIMEDFMLKTLVRLRHSNVLESEHPYAEVPHRMSMSIPKATSVTLRFDLECCSEEDDVLAVFPSTESRNPMLLVSGNNYSTLTTRAATNQFYLEFPFYQTGKMTWMKGSSVLAHNADATIVGYRAHDAWWTVTTEQGVTRGIISFSFCIRKLHRQNLFIGLSASSQSMETFLGKNGVSWGLQANGYLWYNSRRQQFCSGFKENDLVKLVVNLYTHTLSVTINGQFQGVAFRNLPSNQMLLPAVSFFDAGDMVELCCVKLCAVEYTQAPIAIEYVSSESTKEESVQWLKRVPQERLRRAQEMKNMGFEIHMCVLALEATNDNIQEATDYLLANSNELSQKTAHLVESQNKAESEVRNEEMMNWFMSAYMEDSKQRSLLNLNWICPCCYTSNEASQRQCTACETARPDVNSKEWKEANKMRWGFRLLVLPDYTASDLTSLTMEMMARNDLTLPQSQKWTLEADRMLVELASEFCYVNNMDIMTLFPGHLVPNDRMLMKYGRLMDFSLSQLQIRFYVLQRLNLMLRDNLPFINISCDDG